MRSNAVPQRTAISELNTRAPADPKKTESLESQSAEMQNVANWVLSPSSARKIIPKVVIKILKSINFLFARFYLLSVL
jgi:hypothetical protein